MLHGLGRASGALSRRELLRMGALMVGSSVVLGGCRALKASSNSPGASKMLSLEGNVRLGTSLPVAAKCEALEISQLDFIDMDGMTRINVRLHFIDGKREGGVTLKLTLFWETGARLAEMAYFVPRIAKFHEDTIRGFGPPGPGETPPNRGVKAGFRFRDVPAGTASKFLLEVVPGDTSEH